MIHKNFIASDEDIDGANLDIAVKGAYFSRAQECTGYISLIVQSGMDNQFFDKVVKSLKTPHIEHVFDPKNSIIPIVSKNQIDQDLNVSNLSKQEDRCLFYDGAHFKGQSGTGMVLVSLPTAGGKLPITSWRPERISPVRHENKMSIYECFMPLLRQAYTPA